MPRKKKITETVTAEKVESVVGTEATENKQAEAKLEEASLDGLKVVEKVEVSEEKQMWKQKPYQRSRGKSKGYYWKENFSKKRYNSGKTDLYSVCK